MDEAPEPVSPADDETQPGGVGRFLWRGLRVLALLSVMALLGLLIWGLQKGQAGSKYVDQTRAGKDPQAPAFDLPVLWSHGETWPRVARAHLSDGRISLVELRGTPVVLNFWASWCDACKAEAHVLTAAASRYSGRVAFLGMNVQDFTGPGKRYLRHFNTNYVSVRSKGNALYEAYGLTGLPETYFIDRHGRTIDHIIGATTQSELDSMIQKLLAEAPLKGSAAHG